MRPLKKATFFAVILLGLFSFSKSEKTITPLNLSNINVLEILSHQNYQCRPNSDYLFYVETKLLKKSRGFNTINAKIFLMDRASRKSNLLASENIAVPFHKEMISLDYETAIRDSEMIIFENGDSIVGNSNSGPYCFSELIKNEIIYNSYISATNKLLGLNRSW
ncbi:MAG: hypothetical protein GW772_11060 [Flavobacteriia bacterium]|nr:hypothetical protein [Flavobacteriia bacterium]OIP45533.1 MAG: hypothetical protein AUK46_11855 [Flavobacteriaceae bacterium CG2_30_31_66]PIV96787.1 MAG: hypothetical protein COW43_06465 [Flavobacteriaceae bacterium CG17_big_fil_post_rev_8_21_14_2_50_31_13]PIX11986.1 MAG: hypothetical protein COZ74_12445 [Flavobacteriaceae bacterium CG_4_8_14_3_um_filter_31_8]PIY14960.1 MAG: hypothetical protein COZ16_06670 [Flavobacteriaceae bacterium CG_4_10_14_3_um_filter_31_253]PIZ11652.1 MAG: hypotheti